MHTINEVIQGLKVFAKYQDHRPSVCAEHDIIYAQVGSDLTEADIAELEALGWHWDEDGDSWARFV
jgi:hypothetical protein